MLVDFIDDKHEAAVAAQLQRLRSLQIVEVGEMLSGLPDAAVDCVEAYVRDFAQRHGAVAVA